MILTRTIRHGTQDRPIQEEKEWTTQSTDLTLVNLTGIATRVPPNAEPSSPDVSDFLGYAGQQNNNYTQTHGELFNQTIHKHTRIQHHTHYFPGPRGYKTK